MSVRSFPDIQSAWQTGLADLAAHGAPVPGVTDPASIGSDFGAKPRDFVELLNYGFVIRDPRARWIHTPAYRPSLEFAVAQTVWTFAGRDDAESIGFYNPRGEKFADEAGILSSAPGQRIFRSTGGDQFAAAIRTLQSDPTSRRAMIALYTAEDLTRSPRDSSCFATCHLLARNDHLHFVATMRSQSALRVLPYDFFLLSMLHEAAALELGLRLGMFHHSCGSFHYYVEEADVAASVLRGSTGGGIGPMPAMTTRIQAIRSSLAQAEEALRTTLGRDPAAQVDLSRFELDAYWTALLTILIVDTRTRLGVIPPTAELARIPPPYRALLRTGSSEYHPGMP